MSWDLKEREIEAVLQTTPVKRYAYFLQRVCETGKLWSLHHEGWCMMGDEDDRLLPLWPHRAYAALCAREEWADYSPKAIDLHEFLKLWSSRLANQQVRVAVFPLPDGSATVVSPMELEDNLRHEVELDDEV